MTLDGLLRAPSGALRAPWRVAAFMAAAVAGLVLAQAFVYPLLRLGAWALGARLAAESLLLCAALLGAHVATLRGVDRRPWADVGMHLAAWRPRLLAEGTTIGVVAIGLPVLLLVGLGWMRLDVAPEGSSLALALRLAMVLLPAALWEELLFRGYLLTALRDGAGLAVAVLVTSAAFGLVHLSNAGAGVQTTVLVTLAGAWLAGVRLATGSLWAAWLAHWAWNWTLAALWHTPVSGIGLELADYRLLDAGPDWATGGTWGPEGGAFAGLGMIAALLYLRAPRPGATRA